MGDGSERTATAAIEMSRAGRCEIRGTDVTEYWIETAASVGLDIGRADHLAPFLGFLRHQLPNSAGVIGMGSPASSARRACNFGSANTAFTAWFSVSTTVGGVPLGAAIPYQMLTS